MLLLCTVYFKAYSVTVLLLCTVYFKAYSVTVLLLCTVYFKAYSVTVLLLCTEFNSMVTRLAIQTQQNLESLSIDKGSWREQFHNAMNVNGGDAENTTVADYIMHFATFFWKVSTWGKVGNLETLSS